MRIEIAKISNKKHKEEEEEDASFNSYINTSRKPTTETSTLAIVIDMAIVIGIETDIQMQHLKIKLQKNTVSKVENRKREERKSKIKTSKRKTESE